MRTTLRKSSKHKPSLSQVRDPQVPGPCQYPGQALTLQAFDCELEAKEVQSRRVPSSKAFRRSFVHLYPSETVLDSETLSGNEGDSHVTRQLQDRVSNWQGTSRRWGPPDEVREDFLKEEADELRLEE